MNIFKIFLILFSVISLSGCFPPPPPPPPPPIVGTWNVKISAKDSNCRKVRPGNVYTEQWNVNFINGRVTVRTVGSSTGVRSYEGDCNSGCTQVRLHSVGSSDEMEMELFQESGWVLGAKAG